MQANKTNKSLWIKVLTVLCALCCCLSLVIGLVGCSDPVSIAKTEINTKGELVVTYTDGTTANLGKVTGEDGKDGVDGEDGKDGIDGANGTNGTNGTNGVDGKGIANMAVVNGKLLITYTDNTTAEFDVPNVQSTCEHEAFVLVNEEAECFDREENDLVDGYKISVCKKGCGIAMYEVLEASHDWEETRFAATCEDAEYVAKACSVCGKQIEKEYVVGGQEKLEHDFLIKYTKYDDDRTICEDGGFGIQVCQREGCNYQGELTYYAPAGHKITSDWRIVDTPDMDNAGKIQGPCEDCGKADATAVLPALGDDGYEYAVVEARESCNDTQEVTYTYTINGVPFVVEYTEAGLKHSVVKGAHDIDKSKVQVYDESKFTLEADEEITCASTGAEAWFRCADCQKVVFVDVFVPHAIPENRVVATPAKCEHMDNALTTDVNEADGKYETWTCTCGEVIGDEADEYDYIRIAPITANYSYVVKVDADGEPVLTVDNPETTDVNEAGKLQVIKDCANADCEFAAETLVVDEFEATETPATCKAAGKVEYKLTIAGQELTATQTLEKLLHRYGTDAEGNAIRLEGGKLYDIDTYPNIKTEADATITCASGGVNGYFECADCEGLVFVTVRKLHAPADVTTLTVKTPALCGIAGEYESFACQGCGETIGDDEEEAEYVYIAPLKHSYEYSMVIAGDVATVTGVCVNGDKHTAESTTALSQGLTDPTAIAKCNKTYEFTVAVADLAKVDGESQAATCQAAGYTTYKYIVDGQTIKFKVTEEKLDHELPAGAVAVPGKVDTYYLNRELGIDTEADALPACSSDEGVQGYFTCVTCGKVKFITVQTPHVEKEGTREYTQVKTCTSNGIYHYDCANCDAKDIPGVEEIAEGHDFDLVNYVVVNPEASVAGSVKFTCKNAICAEAEKVVTITIPALSTAVNGDAEGFDTATAIYYYNVKQAANCSNQGIFTYTFKTTVDGDAVTVTFEVNEGFASHDYATAADTQIFYNVEGGKVFAYTAKYCAACDRYVIQGAKAEITAREVAEGDEIVIVKETATYVVYTFEGETYGYVKAAE